MVEAVYPTREGVTFNNYTNGEIANGDPVIVVPVVDDGAMDAIMLGTGFDRYTALVDAVDYAMQTGESTQNIIKDRAKELERYSDAERVDVFGIEGAIERDV